MAGAGLLALVVPAEGSSPAPQTGSSLEKNVGSAAAVLWKEVT